ncbi:B12-binding domain-containing radical SAM protein [Lachnospiraceae bacterium 62-35]
MKFLLIAINAKYIHSNLGVYSLKQYAQGKIKEVQIEIGEYTINHQIDHILMDIYRKKPDGIGFSCYIWNISYVLELIRDLKKVLPDVHIWLGGPEVSWCARRMVEDNKEITGIIVGEGEETFTGLLQKYESAWKEKNGQAAERDISLRLLEIPGLVLRAPVSVKTSADSNQLKKLQELDCFNRLEACNRTEPACRIIETRFRPAINMDAIPFVYENCENLRGFENRIIYYESSRGCPFSCTYCLSSLDKSVRFRSMDKVERELDFFLRHRVHQVKFVDRTFNCKKSHAMAVWQYIAKHDNGITNFHFEIAADLLDEEELSLLERLRPGLIQLEIGVQTTNLETLREIRRKTDLKKLASAVARLKKSGNIHQHLDLIAGLPYEDYSSFSRSFCQVYSMEPDELQLGFLKVLKGSYMADMAENYDLQYKNAPPYEVLSTRWLSYEEIIQLKGIEEMVEVYYNSRQFTKTLEVFAAEFESPFALFESLAKYYEQEKLFDVHHNRIARYEILYRFICETYKASQGQEGGDRVDKALRKYRDLLMYDLYLRENVKSRPDFAASQAMYKERLKPCYDEYFRTHRKKDKRMVHIEVMEDRRYILFDYEKRDPLTYNGIAYELFSEKISDESSGDKRD